MDTLDTLLSINQASKVLPISKSSIYNLVRTGTLPYVRIGAKLFFKREIIEWVLDKGTDSIPKAKPVIGKEPK